MFLSRHRLRRVYVTHRTKLPDFVEEEENGPAKTATVYLVYC